MAETDVQKLRTTLAELRRQLDATKNAGPDVRALLRSTMADIEQVLASTPPGEPVDVEEATKPGEASIVDRLTSAAREFEESHPTLAGTVGSVIDAISGMGI
jgi:hypothetical protein